MKKFRICYKCYSDLTIEEIWPDGDQPRYPSVDQVRQVIDDCGGIYKVLGEWYLDDNDRDWWIEEIYETPIEKKETK
jgi:hypothetical protein